MTDAVLLDTHIASWLGNGDEQLRPSTLGLIDNCWRNGGAVLLSAVTAWEIAQLVSTGRIVLDRPVEDWLERLADHPGVETIPLRRCRKLIDPADMSYGRAKHPVRLPPDRLVLAKASLCESGGEAAMGGQVS